MLINESILRDKCRHFSQNISFVKQVVPFIEEVEQLDIKPQLGEALYLDILNDDAGRYKVLLEGGEYEDGCGCRHVFAGLYQAESYYVYARMLRNPNGFLSPTGFRQATDTYSTYAENRERESTIIAVKEAADSYMRDCLSYARDRGWMGCGNTGRRRDRTLTVIGD